jgi:hypothetical protein
MDPKSAGRILAFGRVAIGAALIVAPEKVLTPWIGRDGSSAGAGVVGAAMGARDLALGAGQLASLRSGDGVRSWMLAGVFCDLIDLVGTVRARDDLPRGGVAVVGLMATTGAVAGVWLQSAAS